MKSEFESPSQNAIRSSVVFFLKNLTGENCHAEADESGKVEDGFDGDEIG